MRQIANWAEIRIELEFLPQRNVDARKASTHGRCHRTLQSHAGAFNRFQRFFRDVLTVLLERISANRERLPVKLNASRFQNTYGCLRHFRTDSIARDQRNFVTHASLPSWWRVFSGRRSVKVDISQFLIHYPLTTGHGPLFLTRTSPASLAFTKSLSSFINSLTSLKSR